MHQSLQSSEPSQWVLPDFYTEIKDEYFEAAVRQVAKAQGLQVAEEPVEKPKKSNRKLTLGEPGLEMDDPFAGIRRHIHGCALYAPGFMLPVTFKNQPFSARFVPGHLWGTDKAGPQKASVMVIGKMPGKEEVNRQRNYVSQASQLLFDQLRSLGVDANSWYVTNLVKFAPPDNFSGALPKPWINTCKALLKMELAIVQPDYVLCLGSEASKELLNIQAERAYGSVFDLAYLLDPKDAAAVKTAKSIVSIHPGAVIRKSDKINNFQLSLRQFKDLTSGEAPTIKETGLQHFVVETEYQLESLVSSILAGKPKMIAVDAEWYGRRPEEPGAFLRCFQFSWRAKHSVVVSLTDDRGNYKFQGDPFRQFARLFTCDDAPRLVGHNVKADVMWLRKPLEPHGVDLVKLSLPPETGDQGPHGTRYKGGFDTMLAMHSIKETGPFELESLGVMHLGVPRYDGEVHDLFKSGTPHGYMPDGVLYPYACLHKDSLVQLADGEWEKISSLVRRKYSGEVKAVVNGKLVNAKVTNWHRHDVNQKDWFKLRTATTPSNKHGLLGPVLTPDHKVLTQRGKVRVDQLVPGADGIVTDEVVFTSQQLSVFLGCLLGDGGFARKNGLTVGFGFGQKSSRKAYLDWKAYAFASLSPKFRDREKPHLRYETSYSRYLAHLAANFPVKSLSEHRYRKAIITDNLLLHMGVFGLAVWYQDDGSLVKPGTGGKRGSSRIYCKIDRHEQFLVIIWLSGMFGSGVTYNAKGKFIQIAGKAFDNFHAAINKFMHPSMQYKTTLPVVASPEVKQGSQLFVDTVVEVVRQDFSKVKYRGNGVRYCLTVEGAGNFLTKAGFVSNCYDADITYRLAEIFNGEWTGPDAHHCVRVGHLDQDPACGLNSRKSFWISMMAMSTFLEMEETGIVFDTHGCLAMREDFVKAKEQVLKSLREEINWPDFNPNSINHKKELLFGEELNGKKRGVDDQPVRIRPSEAISLRLMPLKSTGKQALPWARVVQDGLTASYSPSTAKDTLGVFAHKNATVKKLMDLSFVSQALNTALREAAPKTLVGLPDAEDMSAEPENDDDETPENAKQRGLLDYVCSDGAIRSIYFQTKETGRASSAKPNLMAISKRRDKDYERIITDNVGKGRFRPIRTLFMARPGRLLVEADFIGAELAVMAWLSGDPVMMDHVRRSGLPESDPNHFDIHSSFAVEIFRLGLAPIKSELKKAGKEPFRNAVKTLVFGIPYGRGLEAVIMAVKEESGIELTLEEATKIRDSVFARYQRLQPFLERVKERVIHPGYLRDPWGGTRRFTLLDDRKAVEDAKREAGNFRIQSTVARTMSMGLYYLKAYRQHIATEMDYRVVNQIHDAAISECAAKDVDKYVKKVLPLCLSEAVQFRPLDDEGRAVSDVICKFDLDIHVYERWGQDLTHDDCDRLAIPREYGKPPKK